MLRLRRKIEATPDDFRKARRKFSRLFKFFKTEEGNRFLAMQGSKNLQELIEICQRSLSLAESHKLWEFIEKTAEEVRKLPNWVKGGKSVRNQ